MSYIIRIDNPKDDAHRGTHGWQVRVGTNRNYHSKLFSDSLHGGKEEAELSAKEYLEKYLDAHPDEKRERYYKKGMLQSNNTSGVSGVHRTHTYWGRGEGGGERVYYWAAFCPLGPDGQINKWAKRFYVHHHGDHEAKCLAIEFRRAWEEAADEGEQALKQFFDAQLAEEIDFM